MEQQTDAHGQVWIRPNGSNALFRPVDPIAVVAIQIGFDSDAVAHARTCMDACDGWDMETLGHNIESNFPDLEDGEADEIADFMLSH